jgi:tRNA A-37 threonylcarbamoyl transferase component Bud32
MDIEKLADKVLGSDENFVEEAMQSEEATPLGGSLTNDLVETQVGTILKKFSKRPKMAYVQMGGRIPSGKVEFQNIESRIENEEKFREFIEDYDVEMPDIIGVSDEYVEFERVDGLDMNTYLNQTDEEEAEEMGYRVGEFLNYVHGKDGAITDLRINNFMMDYDGELNFVDAEYFSEDATDWEKRMDLITMVSSLKQVDSDSYNAFREGFEDSYDGELDTYTGGISSITSPLHATLLERDLERTTNSVENIKGDISKYGE